MSAPRVIFKNWILNEDSDPRTDLSFEETGVDHTEWIEWIEQEWPGLFVNRAEALPSSRWCIAEVAATVEILELKDEDAIFGGGKVFEGSITLGGCSYPSEHRLWVDLLDQLQDEALDSLLHRMRQAADKYPSMRSAILVNLDALMEAHGR
jgi:hypothetical protein